MKNSNISDDFINSLKRAYRSKEETFFEECPMQAAAIAYAARELDAGEQEKFRDHLRTCRSCLDLVLDIQAAEAESKATTGQTPGVLPALAAAVGTSAYASRTDSNVGELKPWFIRFLTTMMSPKFVSSAAVACLAFIVIHFALRDPEVGRQLDKIQAQPTVSRTEEKRAEGSKADPTSGGKAVSAGSDSEEAPSASTGKTYLFEPSAKEAPKAGDHRKRLKRVSRTPLERMALSRLKLVGIILSEKGNKAMLEDVDGKGYVVKEGTYIGQNSGTIVEITKGKVVIEEQIEDLAGEPTTRLIELKLSNP